MSSSALEPTLGTAPWSAVTTYVQNDAGSLSAGSSESHATERSPSGVSPSQSARSVVLPNPAGADTSVSLASAPRRRCASEPGAGHQTASQLRDVQLGCDQRTRHEIPIPRGTTVSEVVPRLTVTRPEPTTTMRIDRMRTRKPTRRLACPARRRPPDGWAHPGFTMLTKPVVPQDADAVILKQHLVCVGVRHARIEFGVHEADATPGPRRCAGKIARLIIRKGSPTRAG